VSSFFSLVAINEETLNLDDLVEKKVHMEIPVGKGIPTSRALMKWVIFKGRFLSDPFWSRRGRE